MTSSSNTNEKPRILAGIVLYNPNIQQLKANVERLQSQCDEILLVDNASNNRETIEQFARRHGCTLIRASQNEGIAGGLNRILHYASEAGYPWYLSMDQDSLVSENLIEAYTPFLSDASIGILTPFLLNNQKITMEEYQAMDLPKSEEIQDPILCISSAALNRTSSALACGGYDEDLFIDCVDVDYNIRMQEQGNRIVRVNTAYIIQEMGEGHPVPLFALLHRLTKKNVFARLSVSPVYSDFRLYHIARNSAVMAGLYGKKAGRQMQPGWMRLQFLYYLLTYPSDHSRRSMWKAISKGKKDAAALLEEKR